MKLENEFRVSSPVQKVWEALLDLERVTPCLPGAALTEQAGDHYKGTMAVKLGPVTARYSGTVRFVETDERARRAVIEAKGRDVRGQGTASATITSTLSGRDGSTHVRVETDMRLTGRAAQFGRGIQQDVATKMLGQFAECLERKLSGEPEEAAAPQEEEEQQVRVRRIQQPEPEPLDLGEMGREAVAERLKQAAPAIAAGAALLLLIFWLLRR